MKLFLQKELFSSKSHIYNQLLYYVNKNSKNSKGRNLKNVEIETYTKYQSNEIN